MYRTDAGAGSAPRMSATSNAAAPTRLSRALLSVSAFARRRSNRGHHDNDLIDNPRPDTPPIASTTPTAQPQ